MKKILLVLAMMLFVVCFQSKAQDWTDLQHEVSLSYGGLPAADLLHHYENYFDPSTESVNLYDDKGKFGALKNGESGWFILIQTAISVLLPMRRLSAIS